MNTSKFLRKALGLSALPLLIALSTAEVGCLGQRGPSEVARGERYESGDPTYDQFFGLVHELSLELGKAPASEAKIRRDLGTALGVEVEDDEAPAPAPAKQAKPAESASPAAAPSPTDAYEDQLKQAAINAVPGGATVNAVSQQVKQAQATFGQLSSMFGSAKASSTPPAPAPDAPKPKAAPKAPSAALIAKAVKSKAQKLGLEMKLDVKRADEGAEAKLSTAAEPEGEAKKLADLVEQAAKSELSLMTRMKVAKKKLAKLQAISGALEANVDTAFRKSRGQASEVKKNLDDAQALIELMQARVDDVGKKADRMLSKLEESASADLDASAPAAPAASKLAKSQTEPKEQTATKQAPSEPEATESTKPAKAKTSLKSEPKKAAGKPRQARVNALGDFEP